MNAVLNGPGEMAVAGAATVLRAIPAGELKVSACNVTAPVWSPQTFPSPRRSSVKLNWSCCMHQYKLAAPPRFAPD